MRVVVFSNNRVCVIVTGLYKVAASLIYALRLDQGPWISRVCRVRPWTLDIQGVQG
jgi:hypothetical protein